jgi:flagellar biosynthesis protein
MAGKERTIKEAAALAYEAGSPGAPVVTAAGRGHVAEKIVELAIENNVPVVSDALLAHTLAQMDVGEEIPREFYAIVAQILVTVSRMDREYGEKRRG